MPKLKTLSGKDIARIFESLGFVLVAQRGSHAKFQRTTAQGFRQTLTLPMHAELDKGTLKAIYRQAMRFVPEPELNQHFYSK